MTPFSPSADAVGTDITPEYVEIAARRIMHWRNDELFAQPNPEDAA